MYGLDVRELELLPGAEWCECDRCEQARASHMILDGVPLGPVPGVREDDDCIWDHAYVSRCLVCVDCLEQLRNELEEAW